MDARLRRRRKRRRHGAPSKILVDRVDSGRIAQKAGGNLGIKQLSQVHLGLRWFRVGVWIAVEQRFSTTPGSSSTTRSFAAGNRSPSRWGTVRWMAPTKRGGGRKGEDGRISSGVSCLRTRLRRLHIDGRTFVWRAEIRHVQGSGDCHRCVRVRVWGSGKNGQVLQADLLSLSWPSQWGACTTDGTYPASADAGWGYA